MPDTVSTWYGEDINTLPREKLIEIIHTLANDLTAARESAIRDIRFMGDVAKASARRHG